MAEKCTSIFRVMHCGKLWVWDKIYSGENTVETYLKWAKHWVMLSSLSICRDCEPGEIFSFLLRFRRDILMWTVSVTVGENINWPSFIRKHYDHTNFKNLKNVYTFWLTTSSVENIVIFIKDLKLCTVLELVFPLLKMWLKKIIREELKDKDVYLNVIYIIYVRKKIKIFKCKINR